jgi:hypothetical protein
MKLHIRASLRKKADSEVEVYEPGKGFSMDREAWIDRQQNQLGRVVMAEEGTGRYFAGESEEAIFDWYSYFRDPKDHLPLVLI